MQVIFSVYVTLVLSSFLDPLISASALQNLRLLLVASGLIGSATFVTAREGAYLFRTLRFLVAIYAIVLAWMVVQWLPLSLLSNSVWDSGSGALGRPLAGHVSIDLPATLRSIGEVSLSASVLMLGAMVTMDRNRAEQSLFLLAGVAVLGAALDLTKCYGDLASVHGIPSGFAAAGIILSIGCGLLLYERFETRYAKISGRRMKLGAIAAAVLAATSLCVSLLILIGQSGLLVAATAGIGVMGYIIAARRAALSRWTMIAIGSFLLVGAALVLRTLGHHDQPLILAYSNGAPAALDEMRRMIEDAPAVGTGAGTLQALSGLYRSITDGPNFFSPSTAATTVIELGWPMAALIVALSIAMLGLLLRGALYRGRDSVYALVGSGTLVMIGLGSFTTGSLESPSLMILFAALLGLAFGQSRSMSIA